MTHTLNAIADAYQYMEELQHLITDSTDAPPLGAEILQSSAPKPKPLNTKAMTVQLTTRKPTTRHNDEEAAKAARAALGDDAIGGYTTLFKDPTNPIRQLLNEISAIYVFYRKDTLPYIDRGPRLLPVAHYETFRDAMRVLTRDVDAKKAATLPDETAYWTHVQQDVLFRNATAHSMGRQGRATASDYPDYQTFRSSIEVTVRFAPLPDNSHWLFDVDEEDRAALDAYNTQVADQARQHLRERLEKPLRDLIKTLRIQTVTDLETGKRIGLDTVTGKHTTETGIFRDTKVTNVTDELASVRSMAEALDEPGLVTICDDLSAALPKEITDNIDVLRESPVVRQAAAARLDAVASKMSAFFGG